jgi:hypothetical protein
VIGRNILTHDLNQLMIACGYVHNAMHRTPRQSFTRSTRYNSAPRASDKRQSVNGALLRLSSGPLQTSLLDANYDLFAQL